MTSPRAWRLAAWTAAVVVLLAVFAAYLQPELAITLADRLWSCFSAAP